MTKEKMEGEYREQTIGDGINSAEDNTGRTDFSVPKKQKLNKREKALTAGMVVLAVAALFFGYKQVFGVIRNPFYFPDTETTEETENSTEEGLAALKNQDTDGDGLNDFDEFYTYKTSPYLEDSDSDGTTDGEEVARGTDPTCPANTQCASSATTGETEASTTESETPTSGISADLLRQMLIASGVSADTLAQLTDDELLSLYSESLSQAATSDTSAELSSTADINSLADLENLTGAQIREMLIEAGAPEAALSAISDEDLRTMFLEQLKTKENNASQ